MSEAYIFEGSTTNGAIEKGLKELKVARSQVNIRVLEENKRSFFSILAPRVVKVELTLKGQNKTKSIEKTNVSESDIENAKKIVKEFIEQFIKNINIENVEYSLNYEENFIKINFVGDKLKNLIGYRGETLNSLEIIMNSVLLANNINIKVLCNINNYREKRLNTLNELADKVSREVVKKGKSVTLAPMPAYERKIIHTKLQDNKKVKTYSVGEGSRRRLVITLK